MSTIGAVLKQGMQLLSQEGLQNARLDAQVLLAYALEVERTTLYAYPERALSPDQERLYLSLVERRSRGEPVAYLLGSKEFYGHTFQVDPRVLIPRPETELLIEAALSVVRRRLDAGEDCVVADIGTGSGAIPITLALEEPRLPYLYACDVSADALVVAHQNCQLHHVEERVRLLQGDLVAPLPEAVDLLLANLPYVGTSEKELLSSDVVDYEPHLALFGGPQGLDLLLRFCEETRKFAILKKKGGMILEIGYQQREPLVHLLRELWPEADVVSRQDYGGWDRIVQMTIE